MKKRPCLVQDGWQPNNQTLVFIESYLEVLGYCTAEEYVLNFIDSCITHGYKYVDHNRAIRTWVRNAVSKAKKERKNYSWQLESDKADIQHAFDLGYIS